MPAPEFRWVEYEVPAAGRVLRAMAAAPPPELAEPATIQLPDLSEWPSPLDKARILLESAAEVEHALMVQYLYAAYSLKSGDEVTDPAQQTALDESSADSWPRVLLGIAREEMGHLTTVQNLLALLGLPPNLEREDFPPRKDLYPFALHLEPLSQRSLAKYVVAEAPADATGIDDILEVAQASSGAAINRVGILYGLLGLIFTAADRVQDGASGSAEWDELVRELSQAAYQQAPAASWHLPEEAFRPGSEPQQADPQDWQVGGVRVHRVTDRATAVAAIRDVGEQGEGPTSGGERSHYERFLGIYRGGGGAPPFPAPGDWVPARGVPTDPSPADVTDARTKRWAELVDIRYVLLLGFVEHYLRTSAPGARQLLVGWIFAEMRSRVGFIARELTSMPTGRGDEVGAVPFTLPSQLRLPDDEPARWSVHRDRTQASIAKVEEMLAAGADEAAKPYLTELLASDRARLALFAAGAPAPDSKTSFSRDIEPLFRPVDIQHMADMGLDLAIYDRVRESAKDIARRVSGGRRMPPPPDQPWTAAQIRLFERWMAEDFPP
jgi:hypothetical protein